MAQRDKRLKVKLLALAGAGFVLLVVDLLLLTLVVMPLAASTRMGSAHVTARATQGAELALLLPTRDPRTPWPTGTPMRTATPWLVFTPTPEPLLATPVPVESTAPPQSTLAPASPLNVESTALPQTALPPATPVSSAKAIGSTLVTILTPTLQPAAGAATAPPTSAAPPTETPEPAETPVDTPTETPTSSDPTETPVGNPGETPLPPAPPATPGDIPDFEAYLRESRNTIAGQPLDIVSLTMDASNATLPRFVLEVAGSETNDVFAAQPAADVLDYGRRLLDDAKRYLGGEHCAVAVESTYDTSNSDACSNALAWCRLGAYDQAANAWTVTWTYVRGSFTGGPDAIEAWNTSP